MHKEFLCIGIFCCLLFPLHGLAQSGSTQHAAEDLLYEIIDSQGHEAAIQKYRELKKQPSARYDVSESVLNRLGYRLLQESKYDDALAIFKLNADTYPGSVNVWDSLAEANFVVGEKVRAEELYQKVLDMLETDTTLAPPVKNFYRNNAAMQLYKVRNFNPVATAEVRYASFYGGVPAGRWDMQNLSDFKQQTELKISYNGNNLYRSPVPNNIGSPFASNYPADVVHSFIGGDYRRFIRDGKIADISNLWEKHEWGEVFPKPFKKMATVDGKQYFLLMAFQWNPVWYRRDIFKKEGLSPPETWEELLELCNRLNDLGYTPFTIAVQQWPPPVARWFTVLNLRLNGPEFHDRLMQGEVSYQDERIRNVFVHWKELLEINAFSDSSWNNNYSKALQDLNSGKALMYNLGEWIFESLDEEQKAKLDFFAFPEMNPAVTKAEIVHVYGAFIHADSEKPEESKALLDWLADKESQQSNAEANRRTVSHSQIDTTVYTDVQRRIIEHVNATKVLVPLFEMYTHPDFARAAFPIFQAFWKSRDINRAMSELEAVRQDVFMQESTE